VTEASVGASRTEHLKRLSKRIMPLAPRGPGVYLMKDATGEIFYIGKAKSLRARIQSYLSPNSTDRRYFVSIIERLLEDVSFVLTRNEKEAILLESELVRTHQPRFNVELKDDKSFLHLKLRKDTTFPRLEVTRRRKKDGARYFGPYDSASKIRDTLRIVNRFFGLRTCSDSELKNRSRPCLEHQIGRCPAPCVLPLPEGAYEDSIRDTVAFLEGRTKDLRDTLTRRMNQRSKQMRFEEAARLRDQLKAIERSLLRQDVVLAKQEDLDVIAFARDESRAVFETARYREGRLVGVRSYPLDSINTDEPSALVSTFVHQLYERSQDIPPTVLVNHAPNMKTSLEELLEPLAGRVVRIVRPQRGQKRALVVTAEKNAHQRLSESTREQERRTELLLRVQRKFHLRRPPLRIECYDISNISGTDAVGSMVVFTDAVSDPAAYRSFNIRTVEGSDDFASLAEVLLRRLNRGKELGALPDLVILDGGRSQLKVVLDTIASLPETGVEFIALAKERLIREPDHSRSISTESPQNARPFRRKPERVYLPNTKDPIKLAAGDAVTNLFAQIRDEAHRFAIRAHRKKRSKRVIKSELDGISGIGPTRRTQLLTVFGSVQGVREASLSELIERGGLPKKLALFVSETLQKGS